MSENKEWEFLLGYVNDRTVYFYTETCRNQLLALWTANQVHPFLYGKKARTKV